MEETLPGGSGAYCFNIFVHPIYCVLGFFRHVNGERWKMCIQRFPRHHKQCCHVRGDQWQLNAQQVFSWQWVFKGYKCCSKKLMSRDSQRAQGAKWRQKLPYNRGERNEKTLSQGQGTRYHGNGQITPGDAHHSHCKQQPSGFQGQQGQHTSGSSDKQGLQPQRSGTTQGAKRGQLSVKTCGS